MSAHAAHHLESATHGRARLSFASNADIDEFAAVLGQFERGEITPEQWRVFRLVRGTYGQRQLDDAQMIRVKIPQGLLTADQLDVMADVAERYSRGFGHITTRQNVQLHFVKLHDVEPAMRRLAEAGLTTREACGNSVRNITACQFAGVAADEPFDVTPYAEALTRFLLRHPLSASLPRKFKIAFEGCSRDHIKLTINDIGWLAQVKDGRRGFKVFVGGGTATMTTAAPVLFEFLPVEDMLRVAEAILRVFHERGDYQHRQRNRMKFLIKSIGWDGFRAAFEDALAQVRADGGRDLAFAVEPEADEPPPRVDPGDRALGRRDRAAGGHCRRRAARARHPSNAPPLGRRPPLRALGPHQRAAAEAAGLCQRRGHGAAGRSERRTVPDPRSSWRPPTATDRCGSRRCRTWCCGGYGAGACRICMRASRPPASDCPMPTPSPTSPAAPAPSRASWR